jgi:hypothetical protein
MNTRTMRQPRKDVLRDQLVLAADEIIRLRECKLVMMDKHTNVCQLLEKLLYPKPWYRRWFGWLS